MILCCILFFTLIYKLEFLAPSTGSGSAVVELIPPLNNFWECADIDVDCTFLPLDKEVFRYCRDKTTFHGVSGCTYLKNDDIPSFKYSTTTFVPTSLTLIKQTRKPFHDQNRTWETMDVTTKYVVGIEQYMLKIRTFFYSQACNKGCTSYEMQGFLQKNDGYVSKVACATHNRRHSRCESDATVKRWDDVSGCGTDRAGTSEMCSATAWGDYISVGKILEAANITLDDLDGTGTLPTRLKGTAMLMGITYENSDVREFWSSPIGRKWKYTYSFHEVPMHGLESNEYKRIAHTPGTDERIILKYTGFQIIASLRGNLRVFDWFHAFLALFVSMSAIAVANMVVERILLKLYMATSWGRHASAMFDIYKHSHSPDETEFVSELPCLEENDSPSKLMARGATGEGKSAAKVLLDLSHEAELRRTESLILWHGTSGLRGSLPW